MIFFVHKRAFGYENSVENVSSHLPGRGENRSSLRKFALQSAVCCLQQFWFLHELTRVENSAIIGLTINCWHPICHIDLGDGAMGIFQDSL